MTDTAEKVPELAKLAEDRDRKEVEDGEIVADGPAASGPERPLEAKHALEHGWTFWFDNQNHKVKQVDWASSLRAVYTFKTVEDFWCLFNNVLQPSQLVNGADFHCFKEGIEPKWEDPKCAQGGKWSIASAKGVNKAAFPSDGKSGSPIDNYWLHTLLAMIGEQFDDYDEICGVVVSVRARQDRLAIWTKTASNETAQLNIGKQWKQVLDFNEKIFYLVHDDAKRLDKSAKSRYSV